MSKYEHLSWQCRLERIIIIIKKFQIKKMDNLNEVCNVIAIYNVVVTYSHLMALLNRLLQ